MRKSRFTDEQMVAILREAERVSVAEAAKKNKISEQTIYAWRQHFGQLEPSDVKKLKALTTENAKLKKLLAGAVFQSAARVIARDRGIDCVHLDLFFWRNQG